ncbi:hypothetical protein G3I51_13525 [Streptomyces sp. SID9944]|nr:hypothetical protein [Streptomyces sp. SID9944]
MTNQTTAEQPPVDRASLREAARLVAEYTGNPIDANALMLLRIADGTPRPDDPAPAGLAPSAGGESTVPPVDRAALRDHIAEVLWPLTDWDGDELNAERAADAVLAVLPEPADRAAILREAAGVADRMSMEIEQAMKTREIGPLTALQDLADELLRMADEAQQSEPAAGARQDGAQR